MKSSTDRQGPSQRYLRHVGRLPRDASPVRTKVYRAIPQVYFIEDVDRDAIKIGYTDDAQTRLYRLQTGNPCELRILAVIPCEDAAGLEQMLHRKFWKDYLRGEWFAASDELRRLIRVIRRESAVGEVMEAVCHFAGTDHTLLQALKLLGIPLAEWRRLGGDIKDSEATHA